ncbi:SusC/RagA family TonB-linked outer membrane protein [Chitinophaga sp. CF118]|uniref:SusC/RagA family TonB-linked outer membrane protein n=1 Tax=Chitinophaga sp. CF118 TaxID=1884367 RepID=UPI0015A58ED1|nr:SusC/RagA family TonB-linked outer membrane protein [Chitinophaga sp. CF118]
MKLSVILLLVGVLQLSAKSYSQTVTITGKNMPLKEVFAVIKKQTGYVFFYDKHLLEGTQPVNIDLKNASVEEVLNASLKDQPLTFSVENKTVVLSQSRVPVNNAMQPDPIVINGKVWDDKGTPMPGVSVRIKGTSKGTTTNNKGEFSITVPDGKAVVQFTFIGYQTVESVASTIPQNPTLAMQPASGKLDETVVIGYGTTSKRFNTGSISKVNAQVFEQQPVSNPLLALQGRVAGLQISPTSGRPGANVNVTIRGRNSIGAGTDPLYIVDGVPFLSTPLNQFENIGNPPVGNQSPLNSINPDDIESISVLKDADASAIYGSRGANGVILITTKKARSKDGKVRLNANVYSGVGEVAKKLKLLNTQQYLEVRKQALANDGLTPTTGNAPDLTLWSQTQQTDWQKLLIGNTAHFTNADLGISGGNANNLFSLSGSYRKETTVYIGDAKDTRIALHAAYDFTSSDKKFGFSLTNDFTNDNNKSYGGDFTTAIFTAPNLSPYDSTGALNWKGLSNNNPNPLYQLYRFYINKTDNLISNAIIRYTVIPDLNLKLNLGYNMNTLDQFYPAYKNAYAPGSTTLPNATFGNTKRKSFIIEPQADYSVKLGDGQLQLLAGATYQKRTIESDYIYAYNYSTEALLGSLTGASNISVYADGTTDYRYVSVFGRANYNYKGKYILNGSVRRDGSSRFGPGNRYGNFGAVGASWLITQESFMQHIRAISFAKLRASYGTTGNDQITDYAYYEKWRVLAYPYQSITSLIPNNLGNPDYGWERVNKLDLALEIGFLKDRIFLNADFYRNRTSNQLVGYPLPSMTGFTSVQYNLPAVVQNQGWEFELNTTNFKSRKFSWNSSFNITIPQNKLISYPGLAGSGYATTYVIGKSLNISKGFEYTGVDATTGTATFKDQDKNTLLEYALDRIVLGKTEPSYYGGFSNDFKYGNWQLSVLLQYSKQEGYNYMSSIFKPVGGLTNFDTDVLNYWKQPGDNVSMAKPSTIASTAWYNYIASTANWGDASFVRLKNVYLAYNLPANVVSRIKLQNLKVYLQGQNLLTISNYRGLDPETRGIFLPPLRMFTAGIQLSL